MSAPASQAEAANHACVQPGWLKRLAHDLRDPITPLRFAVQQMQTGRVQGDDAVALLRLMDRQIDAMLLIADEVGDLIKLERGESLVHRAPAGLSDILAAAARIVARAAQADTAAVAINCDAQSMLVINADDARLAQLLAHLLRLLGAGTNTECRPELECETQGDLILVYVRDRARPIAPSHRLEYLLNGCLPEDQRSLLMGNLIARQVLEQHQARLSLCKENAAAGSALILELKRAELPTFNPVE